jgi:hypothetical protein
MRDLIVVDLAMLVILHGGRENSEKDLQDLVQLSAFSKLEVVMDVNAETKVSLHTAQNWW